MAVKRPALKKQDFVLHRVLEQTVDLGALTKIRTLTPHGIKKARGQDVLLPPDYTSYQDYWDAFLYVDFVHRAVTAKNATMWQEGFDTVPTKKGFESEKERADELLMALEADTVLSEGTLYAIIFGNMWWEPIRGFEKPGDSKALDTQKLAELKPLDPTTIAAIVDDADLRAGTISEWVQLGPDGRKEEARWDGDELIHLRFNRYRGSPFGTGDLQCVLLTVKQLLYMEQKLPEIVRKRADPTLWILIANLINGVPTPLSDEKFRDYMDAVKLLEPTENLYTGPFVQKVDEIYKGAGIAARQGLEFFLVHFKRKLQSGIAVPDVLLGEGRMTTEATAGEQTELYHQDIRWKQRFGIKRLIEKDIFTRETPPIINVKIEPNPLTPDDVFQTSQRLINEVRAGIIGPAFARKQLGYEELEAALGAVVQPVQPGQQPQGPSKMPLAPLPEKPRESEEMETVIEKAGRPYAVLKRRRARKVPS